jgi:hypothetical protein
MGCKVRVTGSLTPTTKAVGSKVCVADSLTPTTKAVGYYDLKCQAQAASLCSAGRRNRLGWLIFSFLIFSVILFADKIHHYLFFPFLINLWGFLLQKLKT